ncbi:monovalent cation/H+ antiporter complex subunit F [Ignisphaera sp. 4213-co]|uniref:Monovalent cation/H+ antiporter complex subunit F n=1 Tax=Ignisphaera cupida TaxID=3050454 RepID=A0ABD4Z5C3_9CREN|nr:monovalent cation/H+ antiporter complex subunit F [Ignisphaera sp. 4213-co]MDK6028506.1 monovalent cation/H+ antiporter complex subunit F [Ignisphaera sp. 4213-co]
MDLETHVTTVLSAAIPIFTVSIILYSIRFFKGPTIPDMVISVDAISYAMAVFLTVLAVIFKSPILIPCAIVLMLWAYALDIYVAKYLEAKEYGD